MLTQRDIKAGLIGYCPYWLKKTKKLQKAEHRACLKFGQGKGLPPTAYA
jgi:hypothetical protein